jgi:cytochrome c2
MNRSILNLLAVASAALLAAGAAHAAGNAAHGEKVFGECRACHMIDRNTVGLGPSLYGVFGRKSGQLPDFRYSPAFKRSDITWTPETLNTYIADPQKLVPGNRMPYAGLADERDRADLIMYLQQVFK